MAAAVEDQTRLLDDARNVVAQQAHQMRKCLETPGKLMDALKCRYDCYAVLQYIWRLTLSVIQFHPCIRASNQQSGTKTVLRTLHVRF